MCGLFISSHINLITLYFHFLCRFAFVRAGVCRPCDTIELTATSCNFSL